MSRGERILFLLLRLRPFAPLLFLAGVIFLICLPSWPHPTEVEEHAFVSGQHGSAFNASRKTPAAETVLPLATLVYIRLEAATAAAWRSRTATASLPCLSGSLRPSRYPFLYLPDSSKHATSGTPSTAADATPASPPPRRRLDRCSERAHAPAALQELHAVFTALQLESVLQPFYLAEPLGTAAATEMPIAAASTAATLHFNFVGVARSSRGDGREAVVLPFLYDFLDPPAAPPVPFDSAGAEEHSSTTADSTVVARTVQRFLEAASVAGAAQAAALPAKGLKALDDVDWLSLLQQLPPLDTFAETLLTQHGLRMSSRVAAAAAAALAVQLHQHSPWLAKDVILVVADRQLPYAAGLRAFSEEFFRGRSHPHHSVSLGGHPVVHVGMVVELRGVLPLDPSVPAAAAAAVAATADDDEGEDAVAAVAEAALAAGSRWTDPHVIPRKLRQELLLLLQEQQRQPHRGLLLPDYGALSFMHVDFGAVRLSWNALRLP
ncbi:glycosylphosphatidylinositol anchor attachment 1 [Cyclospora cayetanensis]|uniref:Glycosylphosphatidylinositol anchor attachment 1 n=1 Tax=Cyclospora cayetanensis TaxID=88456 RepID=A0A1D3D0R0_9EIME|nr:glycosylphosphatidylinositol anchor attachment 1 [Cyclospora cayetanensis]